MRAIRKHILHTNASHKHTHTHVRLHTGSLCRTTTTCAHTTYGHTKGHTHTQAKFQRWSVCPYLVSVVIATPGLIPCSKIQWVTASPSSSLLFAFFPVCFLMFLSMSTYSPTTALSHTPANHRLLNTSLLFYPLSFSLFHTLLSAVSYPSVHPNHSLRHKGARRGLKGSSSITGVTCLLKKRLLVNFQIRQSVGGRKREGEKEGMKGGCNKSMIKG